MSKFKVGDWVMSNRDSLPDSAKPIFEVTEVRGGGKYSVLCVKSGGQIDKGNASTGDESVMMMAPEQKKSKSRVPEGLEDMDENFALSVLKNILNDSAMDLSDWLDDNDPEGVDFVRKNAQIKSLKEAIRLIERNQ